MELLNSFVFGISIAMAIGPIAILIINSGLNCGLRIAVLSGTGAALADFTYSIVAFSAGSGIALALAEHQQHLQMFSCLVLIMFGLRMLYNTYCKRKQASGNSNRLMCKRPLVSTYGLTIINPLTIVLFVGLAGSLSIKSSTGIFFNGIAVLIGSLLVQLSLALFGNLLGKFLKNNMVIFTLNFLSAVSIILLGITKLI